jgi:hypothetical protein
VAQGTRRCPDGTGKPLLEESEESCLVPEGTKLHLPTATSIMYAWRRFWKSKPGGEGIEDRLERLEAITREKRINKP